MLQGKILKIKWDGRFNATIAGVTKVFDDAAGMHDWFSRIIQQASDGRKRDLLLEDLKHMCNFNA